MAGALGFEPRYAGIKTLCLTAWRRPNQGPYYAQSLKSMSTKLTLKINLVN